MELSADFFEQTISAMRGYGSSGKDTKREEPRVGVRCRFKLYPANIHTESSCIPAWTRDVSRTGMGFICSQAIKLGSRYCLKLTRRVGDQPMMLYFTVKNCVEPAPGVFTIGAFFDPGSIPNYIRPLAAA
jgi:hypothetical protein